MAKDPTLQNQPWSDANYFTIVRDNASETELNPWYPLPEGTRYGKGNSYLPLRLWRRPSLDYEGQTQVYWIPVNGTTGKWIQDRDAEAAKHKLVHALNGVEARFIDLYSEVPCHLEPGFTLRDFTGYEYYTWARENAALVSRILSLGLIVYMKDVLEIAIPAAMGQDNNDFSTFCFIERVVKTSYAFDEVTMRLQRLNTTNLNKEIVRHWTYMSQVPFRHE